MAKLTPEEARAIRQRFGVEMAIDHELRACVARIMGMNAGATEKLLVSRFRLAVADVAKRLGELAPVVDQPVERAERDGEGAK